MFGKTRSIALLLMLIYSFSALATATEYQVQWQDEFSPAEQVKLNQWLAFSTSATTKLLGPYPFTTQLFIHQRSANEPVPWANTWREGSQQVHFYIDPRFSAADFIQDWTAYHEIAHLALPYLGKNNAWFAEGFASFMQYQVMQQAGLISNATDSINKKFRAQRQYYVNNNSMRENAVIQLNARRFAAGYWGGAQFFVVADALLRQQYNTNLTELIQQYQQCCRMQNTTLADVISAWDTLSKSTLFSDLLLQFNQLSATDFMQKYRL